MTIENDLEFTHNQGLTVAAVALLIGIGLLIFSGDKWVELGTIAFTAIAATAFVQRRLLRRPWFLAFLVVMALGQLALVLAFPWADLDRGSFRLAALADILAVLGLAFALENLMPRRK